MIRFVILYIFSVNLVFGQFDNEQNNNSTSFFTNESTEIEDHEVNNEQTENFTPPFPVAPINDYLPLLAVAAVGIGFYYRKELKQITK